MLGLVPDRDPSEELRVLCLGAHADDVEIGCGGTLLRLASGPADLHVRWVVFSGRGQREREARESADGLLGKAASLEVSVLGYPDRFFPDRWSEIKEAFDALEDEPRPDLVFTHRRQDRHQDHSTVGELTWNTFRDHLILEYEVPKYEGDLGRPNAYVALSAGTARRKAAHLVEAFPSQGEKPWFDEETFLGLSRLRGVECGARESHAEAFHGTKMKLEV